MGGRSRVAVRHAAAVAHCSTVEDAATLMKMLALPASPADEASCSGAMASAIVDLALELQRTASFAFPGKKVASLRDGAFHLRRAGAPGSLLKKLGLLNSAASLLRHFDLAWASSLRLELAEALPAVSVLPQERETASSRDGDASSARTSHRAEDDSGASSDLEAPSEAAPAGDRTAAGPDAAAGASVAKLIERFEPPRLAPAQGLPEHPRQPEGSHAPPRQDEPQLGDQHEVPQAGQPLAAQPDAHPLHDVLLHPDGVPGAACAPLRDHDPPAVPLPAVPRADTPPPLGTAALLRGAPWADDETEDDHNDDALDRVIVPEDIPAPAPTSSPWPAASKGKGKSSKGKSRKGKDKRAPPPRSYVLPEPCSTIFGIADTGVVLPEKEVHAFERLFGTWGASQGGAKCALAALVATLSIRRLGRSHVNDWKAVRAAVALHAAPVIKCLIESNACTCFLDANTECLLIEFHANHFTTVSDLVWREISGL